MRRNAFGANVALLVSVSRISARTGTLKASSRPPLADTLRKSRRFISRLRIGDARGLLDRGADARIGAAAADVAGHGVIDIGVARLGRCGEQGARRHDLARLAVAALRHVEREPRLLDFLARRRAADGFDRGDALAERRGDWRDARARRLSVDLDSARAAKALAAAELRARHVQHVAQRP